MKTRKLWTTVGLGAATFGLVVAFAFAQTETPTTPPENGTTTQPAPATWGCGWGPGTTDAVPPDTEGNDTFPMWGGMMGGPGMMGGWGGMMGGPGMMGRGMMGGPGMMGMGPGMMGGAMHGGQMMRAMGGAMAIPSLLEYRDKVQRGVTLTEKGVETVTESDDPAVVQLIQAHAEGMKTWLLEAEMPFRTGDPLFEDFYAHRNEIKMTITKTDKGVRVVQEGTTPEAVEIIQAMAAQMDRFIVKGWEEYGKLHPSPLREQPTDDELLEPEE